MPDRPRIFVHPLPVLIPSGALAGGVAVVIDVLRATTTMVHALAAGCPAIIPCEEVEDARAVAAALPPGSALLGGERGGLLIEGFDRGNSPADYTPDVCQGKTLVMTTTNGTRAILASRDAERVLIAAFGNLGAVADELTRTAGGRPIHLVCAGTEGFISLEDSLLAGALTCRLLDCSVARGAVEEESFGNDAAVISALQWLGAESQRESVPLSRLLAVGRGGHNVRRIGLEPDIEAAAQVDRFAILGELRRDPLRITAPERR